MKINILPRSIGEKVSESLYQDVPLDAAQCSSAEEIMRSNPMVKGAIMRLLSDVFSVDPEVFWDGKRVQATPAMQDELRRDIIPCCHENLKSVFATGLGAVSVKPRSRGSDEMTVRFPKDGGVFVSHYDDQTDDVVYYYTSERSRSREDGDVFGGGRRADVYVLSGFGFDPSPDGKLNSMVAAIYTEHAFLTSVQSSYSVASHSAARPTVYTERDPDKAPEPFNFSFFADRNHIKKSERDKFYRERLEIEASRETMRLWKSLQREGSGEEGGGACADAEPFLPLPEGQKSAKGIDARAPPEFCAVKEMSQEMCCSIFGVARAQLVGKEFRGSASSKSTTEQYKKVLRMVKHMASDMLTEFYRLLHGEEDMEHFLSRRAWEPGSSGDASPQSFSARFVLPPTPDDTVDDMLTKYFVGSVTEDELHTFNRTSAGLDSKVMRAAGSTAGPLADPGILRAMAKRGIVSEGGPSKKSKKSADKNLDQESSDSDG